MQVAQAEIVSELRAIRARLVDEISMLRVNRKALAEGFEGPAANRSIAALSVVMTQLGKANQELAAVQAAVAAVAPPAGPGSAARAPAAP